MRRLLVLLLALVGSIPLVFGRRNTNHSATSPTEESFSSLSGEPAKDSPPQAEVIQLPITPINERASHKKILVRDSAEKEFNSSKASDDQSTPSSGEASNSSEESATQIVPDGGKYGREDGIGDGRVDANNTTLDAETAEGLKLLLEQAIRQAEKNHENGLRRGPNDVRNNHGSLDGVKIGDYVVRDDVVDPRLGLRRYVFQKNGPVDPQDAVEPEVEMPTFDREKRRAGAKESKVGEEATIKNETETHGWKSWILQFGKDPERPKPNISSPDNSPVGETHPHRRRREALGEGSDLVSDSPAPTSDGAVEPTVELKNSSRSEMAARAIDSEGNGTTEVRLQHFVIIDPIRLSANKKNDSSSSSSSSSSESHHSQRTHKHLGKYSSSESASDEKPGLKDFLLRPKPHPKPHPRPHPSHNARHVNFIHKIDVKVVKTGPIVVKNSTIQVGGAHGPKPHFPAGGLDSLQPPPFGLPVPPPFQSFFPQHSPLSMHHARKELDHFDHDEDEPPHRSTAWAGGKGAPPMLTLQVRPCLLFLVAATAAILLCYKLIISWRRKASNISGPAFCSKHDGGEKSYCSSSITEIEGNKTHMKA